jgi:branched-chain amino acid transport system substrate-binding protein
VQFANQLIGRKVPLMLGPSSVAGCRAVAPLVTNGPVAYGLSAAGPTPKGGYSFTADYSTVDAVRTALSYFRERGWHKLAILDPTDATGQDGEAGLDADSTGCPVPPRPSISATARSGYLGWEENRYRERRSCATARSS